jgi:hypothetical protein
MTSALRNLSGISKVVENFFFTVFNALIAETYKYMSEISVHGVNESSMLQIWREINRIELLLLDANIF